MESLDEIAIYQKALSSDQFDDADKAALKWQFGHHGGFFTKLYEAIARADMENQAKLRLGFSNEVEGYKRWSQGDLFERFEAYKEQVRASNGNSETHTSE